MLTPFNAGAAEQSEPGVEHVSADNPRFRGDRIYGLDLAHHGRADIADADARRDSAAGWNQSHYVVFMRSLRP